MHDRLLQDNTRRALATACDLVGLDGSQAQLLRLHANTVIHLPNEATVARLASQEAAAGVNASLTVTEHLASLGFPTVRPRVGRAVCVEGLVVSFWVFVETVPEPAEPGELASLLKDLHSRAAGNLPLPAMVSPLRGVARALEGNPEALDAPDRTWLSDEVARCEARWQDMTFELPAGMIHGDAHPNNLLRTTKGAMLGDWDHVAHGPREWDLVQELYFARRFPTDHDDPDAAARNYGWDLRNSPCVDDLISIREVSGLGAYIRTSALKPAARNELAYRIGTLRDRRADARWNSPSTF